MTKKYLISQEDIEYLISDKQECLSSFGSDQWAIDSGILRDYLPEQGQEVEVLDEKQFVDTLFKETGIAVEILFELTDCLKSNNLQIIKIKE